MKPYYDLFQFNRSQFQKMAMTLVLCLAIQVVHAGSYIWNGSQSTSWSASANWTPNGVPSTNDTVTINNGNVSSILLDGNRTIARLVISANTIDLNTYELHVSGRSSLNGGSITNGNLKLRGTYAFFQGTNFYCVMDVISGQLKFSGGVFDQGGSFEQTGTASGFGDGGCTFNGNVTLKNSGATILRMGQFNDDIFNADVTYTCTGTSALQPAYSDSTFYNGNVYLNNTGSGGILFCNGTSGIGILANGKTIGVGTTGLTAGVNTLKNILQNGSTAQSITTTSTLNITACTFNGSTTITAAGILVKGSTFNSIATFTKTGNANNYWDGANVFNGTTTINNNTTGNGVLRMALQSGDVYAGDVNFNTSTGPLQVAFSGNSEFRGNVNINHSKVVFNAGSGTVLCTGSTAQQWSGSADFAIGKLILNKSANGITLQRATTIDSSLTLTKGIIFTDSINIVTLKASGTCSGASHLSYVDGPMQKIGNTSFIFPIGKNGNIRKFGITAPSSVTDNFRLEFINNFTGLSIIGDGAAGTIPGCDYWKLNRLNGTSSVNVSLYWDSLSCETQNYSVFRVANYDNSIWEGDANSVVYGNELNGNVTSSVNYSNTSLFTISGLFCNNSGTITVLPEPGVTINYGPGNPVGPLNICVGQSITFTFDQSVINCLTNFSGFGYYGIIPPVGASVVTQVFPSNSSITYAFNLPGTYTIVTKINNVAITASQVLNQPNQSFIINVQQPNPDIFLNNVASPNPLIICDGQSESICADQTYPSYLWSTGATTQCINVNQAGNYSLIVTDNIGCTGITDVDVQVISCCSLTVDLTAENACLPATEGSITGDITNGTAPYNIAWQQTLGGTASGNFNTSTNPFAIPNLAPGAYTVTVTDANNCTVMATAFIVIGAVVPQASILGSSYSCAKNGIDPPGVNLPFSIVNPNPNFTYDWSSIQAPSGWNITPPMTVSTTNQINPGSGVNTLISFPITGLQGGLMDNYLIQVITTAPNGCTSSTIYPVNWCCHELQPSGQYEWENESASNVAPLASGDAAIIRGVFQVDVNTIWDGVTVQMDPGAQIIVNPGVELFIDGSTITHCENFWRSILVDNGLVTVFNSTIEGAQYAIDVINGGGYSIQKGNVLQNNFVSLQVTGAGGAYPRIINNTTITKTNTYDGLTDYNGQSPPTCYGVGIVDAPHHGIFLREAGQNTIGTAVQTLPLLINNVFIGIESRNTDVTIVNTKISQLIERPCIPLPQWSRAGIYSHGSVRSTIVNTPAPNHCTFDNCRTGIFGDDVELIASGNNMNNVTFGIRHHNPPSIFTNKRSLISNNTIRSSFEGIRITSATGRNHHTDVRGNIIIALPGTPNGAGIRWEDFIIAGKQNDISGNTITLSNNFRWGIRFLNHNDYRCTLNNITLNSALQINGINAVGNRNFTINENTVTDLFTSTLSRGINIQTSSSTNAGNRVQCNVVGNCRMDFLFDQSTLNVDWASNTLNGGRTGLQLQNGAALTRTQPWNWWCGNFTNWWINSIGGSIANWIQYNVSNGGCITTPNGLLGQIGGAGINFVPIAGNDPGCPRPVVVDPLEITEQDRWVATDSNWTTMDESILWQYRRSLSDKLVMHPALITSDSIVNNFWQDYQSLDEIQLAGLMKNTVLIDSMNASGYGTLAQYTDSIISMRNLLIYNDSLLLTGLSSEDSIRIQEENISYSSQIAAWGMISDSLYYIFNQELKIYRDSVFQLYNTFSPQTERGNTEKSIWKLILTYGMGSDVIVTDQDSVLIAEYANLCMLEYGPSIAAIRSFYESYTGLILDDEDVCVSGERIRNNALSSSDAKVDFTLHPNPTKSNVQVITQNLKDGVFTIQLFNAQGVLLLNQTSQTAISTIALEGFISGVYYVNFVCSEGVVTKKLIILR